MNESLGIEGLLMPRYKICPEGYPDMPFKPEAVICLLRRDEKDQPYYATQEGEANWYEPYFDRFPNIFRKLLWWQGVDVSVLKYFVKYIKWDGGDQGELIVSQVHDIEPYALSFLITISLIEKKVNIVEAEYATEEEYKTYIKKQK